MNKNTKKNNKGFSLVELIVVVLIMAIIAVAMAPQVMKWVNRSRISADVQTYDGLISDCQIALTNEKALTAAKTAGTITLTIGTNGTTCSITDDDNDFVESLTNVDANWEKAKKKLTSATDYTITIDSNGSVTRTANAPTVPTDFDN